MGARLGPIRGRKDPSGRWGWGGSITPVVSGVDVICRGRWCNWCGGSRREGDGEQGSGTARERGGPAVRPGGAGGGRRVYALRRGAARRRGAGGGQPGDAGWGGIVEKVGGAA